jgi:hypothetical protein
MEKLLAELERSYIKSVGNGSYRFWLGNGNIGLGLTAHFSGDEYTRCLLTETTGEDVFTLYDQGCNGSVEAFGRGDNAEDADPWGMAPVLNSLLIDFGRFTAFASEMFPK